ncbi:MAG: HEAT repeat domain-containing protein, partial [Planctomycetota bacterium]
LEAGLKFGDVRAVLLAARLGLAGRLLPALANASRTGDDRLTAAAATALGTADHDDAAELVAELLGHTDARVRSNAIEAASAIAQRRGGAFAIEPLLGDRHHRPRATALVSAARHGPPGPTVVAALVDLLGQAEALPRAAGLWALERSAVELKPMAGSAWPEIGAVVAALATRNGHPSERARATRVARRMLSVD